MDEKIYATILEELRQKNTSETTTDLRVSGFFLKAFLAVFPQFSTNLDLNLKPRKLQDYVVAFTLTEGIIYIHFRAKLAQGERAVNVSSTSLGFDITYEVSMATFETIRWYYMR